MERPLVSVILTSYNKPRTVGKAIKSVVEQNYPNWELLIMDDASREETIVEISKYTDNKRIYYFNSGIEDQFRYKTTRYATLINEAIPKTKGKFISYLTDDTIYSVNRLKKMVTFLERYHDVDIVYSGQKVVNVNEKNEILSEKIRKTKGILSNAANIVDHCSVMHTRRIAEKVYKNFNSYWPDSPMYWHNGDAAFWTRLNHYGKFYPIDEVLDISYKSPLSFQNLNTFLPEELPEGTLVKGYLPEIYLLENKQRRKITRKLFEELHYDDSQVIKIPDPYLFKYEIGPNIDKQIYEKSNLFPSGRLVSSLGEDIYYIQNRKKRKFPNIDTLKYYNFSTGNIVHLEKDYLKQIEEGPTLSTTLMEELFIPDNILFYDGEYYYLSQNNRLHEINPFVLTKLNIAKGKAVQITHEEKVRFKEGTPFEWNYYKNKKKRKRKKKIRNSNVLNVKKD